MWLTLYFYWTAGVLKGAVEVIYAESHLNFLSPLHFQRLQLIGAVLTTHKRGGQTVKYVVTTGMYC